RTRARVFQAELRRTVRVDVLAVEFRDDQVRIPPGELSELGGDARGQNVGTRVGSRVHTSPGAGRAILGSAQLNGRDLRAAAMWSGQDDGHAALLDQNQIGQRPVGRVGTPSPVP